MGSRSGTILGLVALIISAGVGGYVLYDNFIVVTPSTNQWYDSYTGSYLIPSGESWATLGAVTIDFTVNPGQAVHYLFIGQLNFDDSSTASYVEIEFSVDGLRLPFPRIYVRRYNEVNPGGLRMSVSLQLYNTTITSGVHSITLAFRGDSMADSVREFSLFAQTYN